jgi:hypothetical protein
MHIVKVDRTRTDLVLDTALGNGSLLGMGIVSDQAKLLPPALGQTIAAVNGDFYNYDEAYPGDPQGIQICHGELVSAPCAARACFWVDGTNGYHRTNVTALFTATFADGKKIPFGLNEDRCSDGAVLFTAANGASTRASGGVDLILEQNGNGPWMPLRVGQSYSARIREIRAPGVNTPLQPAMPVLSVGPALAKSFKFATGAVIQVSMATLPDLSGASTAIGGGPTLVREGKPNQLTDTLGRHPRTAIGWNKDYFYMVVVDGRQGRLSLGMTLTEFAAYMRKIGCDEALNLDGGGSTTLWLLGNMVNSPSQGAERPAANALILIDKSKIKK